MQLSPVLLIIGVRDPHVSHETDPQKGGHLIMRHAFELADYSTTSVD